MFVQYYGMVERPFAEVEAELLSIGDTLTASADSAYRLGEGLLIKIGGGAVAKTVLLDLRTPVRGASSTILPLEWWATGTPALFPKMEAELTVADMGNSLTQVQLQGNYQPPLGSVGRILDRAVLHRFAEASVKDFVDRVVTILSHPDQTR
ncbi:MAG: hypothetical protein HZA58_06260 [Acidimicrobiia bacterium]|nr:hypothetical protein [Acidimicrobiia bacterium]